VHELGCDVAQGYLISQPIPPHMLGEWKREFRDRWPSLVGKDELALWREVELDSLREG